jgi:membrane-bound metal-dependent hydrolase YbcI (DUF457 family)
MFFYTHALVAVAMVSFFTVEPLHLLTAALIGALPDLDILFSHRKWFSHSIFSTLIFTLVAYAASSFSVSWAFITFIAAGSHVLTDCLTKSGVPLFGPFKKKDVALPLFLSSGHMVNITFILISCIILGSNLAIALKWTMS